MKTIFSLGTLAIITAVLIVISCQKSKNDTPNDPNKPIEYVTASISGRILDNNNQPVNGAIVKAGTTSATTDINGGFRINHVSLDKNAGFVKVEKDGFYQGSRTIVVNEGVVNYVSITLIKKTVSGTVSGSSGGNITVQGGGSIVFTGSSFVNPANNNNYTGTVSVSTFFINPTATNFKEIMPGTLRGINTANEETGLQSFGMMAVELTGTSGEKLQLAAGKTATLAFPIPAALQAQAPATIPLWSFNDTTGLWKEEGSATKQGTNYVGTVSHFSFWNCDFPYGVVDFKAVIKDQNGKSLYPTRVELKTIGDSVSIFGYGYTDTTGLVSGKIPKGKTLQLTVYNLCNTVAYTQNIGPFNTDADLGTITLNYAGTNQVTFSGSGINCNATPVTNGFVDVSIDSIHYRASITNGTFNTTITRCSNTPGTAVITAYDLANNQIGAPTNVAVTSATVNAGQQIACGTALTQYLSYTVNGAGASFIYPADSFKCTSYANNYIAISAGHKGVVNPRVEIMIQTTGTGTIPLNNMFIYKGQVNYMSLSKSNINITEFGASGGYISGNFSGTLYNPDDTLATPAANVIFRIKR